MKVVIGVAMLFAASAAISAESTAPIGVKSHCWHDGKANSVGAVLKVASEKKMLRCTKVLVVEEDGNSKEVIGWVEAEISSKDNPRLLTFKEG